jgi:heme-degrading monooxygenase HmoA
MRLIQHNGIMLVAESEDPQGGQRAGREGGERDMYARVSKLEGSPEQVDELERIAAEWIAPSLTQMEGFRGILALASRQSGEVQLVTLWESEEALRQSEEYADQLRDATAQVVDGEIAGVERYEVVLRYTL